MVPSKANPSLDAGTESVMSAQRFLRERTQAGFILECSPSAVTHPLWKKLSEWGLAERCCWALPPAASHGAGGRRRLTTNVPPQGVITTLIREKGRGTKLQAPRVKAPQSELSRQQTKVKDCPPQKYQAHAGGFSGGFSSPLTSPGLRRVTGKA